MPLRQVDVDGGGEQQYAMLQGGAGFLLTPDYYNQVTTVTQLFSTEEFGGGAMSGLAAGDCDNDGSVFVFGCTRVTVCSCFCCIPSGRIFCELVGAIL